MAAQVYYRHAKTGGGADAMDAIDYTTLSTNDCCIITDGSLSVYKYDATETGADDGDQIVIPDNNGTGSGAWVKQEPESKTGTIGLLGHFPIGTPPTGWLECDGSAISRTTYADLFGIISDDYGPGDGSSTFNLPDYRGQFLRGWDHGAGVDPDAASRTDRGDTTTGDAVGTQQADQNDAHTHNLSGSNPLKYSGSYYKVWTTGSGDSAFVDAVATTAQSSGGNEARPTNVNVMICIYYGG